MRPLRQAKRAQSGNDAKLAPGSGRLRPELRVSAAKRRLPRHGLALLRGLADLLLKLTFAIRNGVINAGLLKSAHVQLT